MHGVAYTADPVVDAEKQFNVFFNEALTILAALEWAATLEPPPKCLAIHTDSMTSFGIFNSLWAISTYNPIILQSVKVRLKSKIDLQVFHIDGKKNTIANALSRHLINLAHHFTLGLLIRHFKPPLELSGAARK